MNNQTNQNRPDKSLFLTMMGVFFLLFCLAPFYWAFYNYGEYTQTNAFVGDLREKSAQTLTSGESEELKNRIASNASRAERYKLEMFLSGAGGFVLLGISAFLFFKAFKSRGQKPLYELIDPRTIPLPPQKIEVRYKKLHDILILSIALFFGAMLLFIVYQNFTNPFMTAETALIRSAIFTVPVILLLIILSYLTIRAKLNALKTIDETGITRGDGRHFSWHEFCGVVTQTARNRFGKSYVWRSELAFTSGETAWIIPHRVKNHQEVFDYVFRLPQANFKV